MNQEKSPLISVVMPVYNVEKYVERAIKSIITQTFEKFEFIIVDDGSKDESAEICERFAKKDNRIIIKKIENTGVANARNIGVENAKGKYIYFIDSDDWVDKDMLLNLYNAAESEQNDLVIAGFNMVYILDGQEKKYNVKSSNKQYCNLESFSKDIYKYIKMNLINTPWNKLYLKNIINENNIKFEKRFAEDLFFNVEYIKKIQKIAVVENTNYYWNRSREGSETDIIYKDNEKFLEEKYSVFKKILELYSFLGIDNEKNLKEIYNYYASRLVQFVQELTGNTKTTRKEKIQKIKEVINDERTQNTFKIVKADKFFMKICYIPLKYKFYRLTYLEGILINFFKKKCRKIFYFLRTNQVNK